MAKQKPTKEDKDKIQETYITKVAEYSELSLHQLKELYQKGKLGGMYKRALIDVVAKKLQEVRETTIKDKLEEIKEKDNESKEEVT